MQNRHRTIQHYREEMPAPVSMIYAWLSFLAYAALTFLVAIVVGLIPGGPQ